MTHKVTCASFNNQKHVFDSKDLTFRQSVYGIIIDNNKVLLNKHIKYPKYQLPGGGIEIHEDIKAALHREIMEETGIKVKIQKFLTFKEGFFFWNLDNAWHSFLFYYKCKPLTTETQIIADKEIIEASWVDIHSLKPEDFMNYGKFIIKLINSISSC